MTAPIGVVKAENPVSARNEFTGEEGFKPVVHLFRNPADRLVHLSYRRDPGCARRGATGSKGGDADEGDDPATITGTNEHPFWSLTRNAWVEMAALKPGERLLLADGEATVTAIRIEHLETPVTVYNFEVADWHTYQVGSQEAGWVFVHNRCHGNSLRARRHQHRYEIVEISTGKVSKTGISGQKLNIDGSSPRANRQVNAHNLKAGYDKYEARVVEKNIPGRKKAKRREQIATNRLHEQGHPLDLQRYPRPQ
jgi:hypothetical protein